ncbi:MAG: phospho-sugar mutase [Bacteroidetes bacterium]|nr:MAG: phospho-sugar mutase [Bacteroidota bacterium]
MTESQVDRSIVERAEKWLNPSFDESTRKEVQSLLDAAGPDLVDAFYKDLEFGTGGLRGILGAGTNKMNIYTVGMATQGLANYLLKTYNDQSIRVAIAHDSRNNSRLFAKTTAEVFAANGIEVYLFDELRPTPELSFTVRHLGCQAGVVLTASHNPKEYNGYKVYWNDGGQLVPPHDKNTIEEVRKIGGPEEVKFSGREDLIHGIGADVDEAYLQELSRLSKGNDGKDQLRIVYTPIHGTGVTMVPKILERFGFKNVEVLAAQATPDGNFPTVHSPNPEEAAALDLAIQRAKETGADLVLGTDPDADRVGIAVKNSLGEMELLNGNETAAILFWYYLSQMRSRGELQGNEFIAKTIVTSDLLSDIAEHFGVKSYECLTGFKYIAELIREKEGVEKYLIGGEESYGYLIGDFVRDKDAVSSAAMIAEAAAWALSEGKSLIELLEEVHRNIAVYQEALVSLTKKGKSGAEEIQEMMRDFRSKNWSEINGSPVVVLRDYQSSQEKDLRNGEVRDIFLPKSNVFQFVLADKSVITARPSGTEPKIKFYISVQEKMEEFDTYLSLRIKQQEKIEGIKTALKLN